MIYNKKIINLLLTHCVQFTLNYAMTDINVV